MKYTTEVFHDDNLKGNFLIVDGTKYGFYVVANQEPEVQGEEDEEIQSQKLAITQVVYNEDKSFVDSQQFLFDNLCNNASHARERIREIGRGIRGDFNKLLSNHLKFKKLPYIFWNQPTTKYLYCFLKLTHFAVQNIMRY